MNDVDNTDGDMHAAAPPSDTKIVTRVYRYGALAPTENLAAVADQMRSAHKYRNTLTQIERGRRDAIREAVFWHRIPGSTTVGALELAAAENDARVIEAVVSAGKHATKEEISKKTKDLRDIFYASLKILGAARKKAISELSDKIDEINEIAGGLKRNARKYCSTFWGTYLLIEAAASESAKVPLWDGLEPNDPHYVRWTGEGRIGSQIQGGISSSQIFSTSETRLRVEVIPLPENASKRQQKRRHAILWIRIGSIGRAPVWAKVPFLMHRELSEMAVISGATVTLRHVGPTDRWSVELTVKSPVTTSDRTTAVAVDLGWRVIGDEIRVASWAGEDGERGEVRLDRELISQLTKAASLRSIRDRSLDDVKVMMMKYLSTSLCPAWLHEATRSLAQWRSPARFASLALRWKNSRFEGDTDALAALEAWRVQDRHLWEWEAHQRMQGMDKRLKLYEMVASKMSQKYGHLIVEKFNMTKVALVSADDSPRKVNANSNRQLVSTSVLRVVLCNAFVNRGCTKEMVSSVQSTHECYVCGQIDEFDAAANLEHTCSKCDTTWDQDYNAARVLLARSDRAGVERVEALSESRWKKARSGAAARKTRMKTARKPDVEHV